MARVIHQKSEDDSPIHLWHAGRNYDKLHPLGNGGGAGVGGKLGWESMVCLETLTYTVT